LVTSKGGESDRFWGKRQGADDHVGKPTRSSPWRPSSAVTRAEEDTEMQNILIVDDVQTDREILGGS